MTDDVNVMSGGLDKLQLTIVSEYVRCRFDFKKVEFMLVLSGQVHK